MKRQLVLLVVLGSLILEVAALPVSAAIPTIYTNDNFFTSEHDAPVLFTQDVLGNFFGMTISGKLFYQNSIINSLNIRLQRFSINEAFFYISDRGII